jgi:outer membrane protein TolC
MRSADAVQKTLARRAGAAGAAVALFLGAPGALAVHADERRLTLDEAIERALRHNSDIIVQNESVEAAEAGILAAKVHRSLGCL